MQQDKKNKWKAYQLEKKKVLLFSVDIIVSIEILKEIIGKPLELINDLSELVAYEINTQNSTPFLYDNNEYVTTH